jgi:regulator of sigma E protease
LALDPLCLNGNRKNQVYNTSFQHCRWWLCQNVDEREGNVAEQDLPYAFNRQSPWKRIAIVAAGPLINLIFAVLLFWILFLPAQEQLNTRIGKIVPNTPAAQVNLHVGDKVVMVDGQTTPTWEKLNYALVNRVGETGQVSIVVERTGTEKQFSLPIKDFLKDQSQSPLDELGFYLIVL